MDSYICMYMYRQVYMTKEAFLYFYDRGVLSLGETGGIFKLMTAVCKSICWFLLGHVFLFVSVVFLFRSRVIN